jgi:hypothetical protein
MRIHPATVLALPALILVASLTACSDDTTTEARFSASNTPPAPGVVKLVQKSRSGSRVVIDVVIFGPEPGLDLFDFQFGIAIGNSDVLRFVTQQSYTQTALVAGAGQTIVTEVSAADPSLVEFDVRKTGGGAGNGFATASAIVIEVAFDARTAGTSTLSFSEIRGHAPRALDSALAPIGDVRFDAQSATVTGVTTGGGGY